MSEIISILKETPVLSTLTDKQIQELSVRSKIKKYSKDDFVLYKGDDDEDVYIVVSGTCRSVLIDDDGDEVLLSRFNKDDIFGEVNVIDQKGRSTTIVADGELVLLKIFKEGFNILLRDNAEFAVQIIQLLAERLRKADELIESLAFLNVKERVIKRLVDMGRQSGRLENGYFIIGKLTHQEISSMIGASRESVTKCLKILNIERVLKIKDDCIMIKEPVELF